MLEQAIASGGDDGTLKLVLVDGGLQIRMKFIGDNVVIDVRLLPFLNGSFQKDVRCILGKELVLQFARGFVRRLVNYRQDLD